MRHAYFTYISTMLGEITLLSDGDRLTGLYFDGQKNVPARELWGQHNPQAPIFLLAEKQLGEFLQGQRRVFEVPYKIIGGTDFQQKVWHALVEISCGETVSY